MKKYLCIFFCIIHFFLFATSGTWNTTTGGNWTDTGNWAGGTVPNAIDDDATFNTAFVANTTINLDQDITLGALDVDLTAAAGPFTIDSSQLVFRTSSGNASCTVTNPGGLDFTV